MRRRLKLLFGLVALAAVIAGVRTVEKRTRPLSEVESEA